MKNSLLCLALAGLSSFALPGCGSGGGGVNSGVAPNKIGTDLSPSEAEQLCEASINYFESVFSPQVVCTIQATAVAKVRYRNGDDDQALQKACAEAEDACNAAPPEDLTGPTECDEAELEECKATVADIELCIQEVVDGLAEAVEVPGCSSLTRQFFADQKPVSTDSAADTPTCKRIEPVCPL